MYHSRVLLLILVASMLAYVTHLVFKRSINPRRSGMHLLLYLLVNLVNVVLWVFLFTIVFNRYKDFFFKR